MDVKSNILINHTNVLDHLDVKAFDSRIKFYSRRSVLTQIYTLYAIAFIQ